MDSPYYGFGEWIEGPDDDIRQKKLQLEEELMIRLGAKKEVIEYHPLLLSSKVERAKSFVGLQYSRVTPPFTEKSSIARNSWKCQDQALRQMSNPSRRGPRDIILPNLVKSPTELKMNQVPEADFGYFSRREAILERLTQVLSEWTAYQKRAFPPLINSRLSILNKPSSASQRAKHTKRSSIHKAHDTKRRKSYWTWSDSSDDDGSEGHKVRKQKKRRRKHWNKMAQEVLLQVKASHMRLPLQLPKSELRIYVSSTPDLHEEREFLEEVAYPKLKELAEKLGLNCHFVDMRKGSGHLSNDVETFDLIQKEVQNCRRLSIGPHFISLLGHQLDDQKLPGFLEKPVYEEIRETLIRDDIIGVEMFDEAYRLDSNRLPPVYIKQPLQAINEYQGPEVVEQIILTALNKAVELIKERRDGDPNNNVDFYKWSAVVREVENGLLTSYNPRRETLCFLFDGSTDAIPPSTPEPEDPMERLRHRVTSHLNRYASKSSLMHFKTEKKTITYLRSLADTFIASVASLLKSQLHQQEFDVTQQLTEGSEALQHVRVGLSESEHIAGNGVLLQTIQNILGKSNGNPMTVLLEGASGMGKTAFVSQIAKSCSLWQPRGKVVFRSLGCTLRSSSLFRVVESLIKQLSFIYSLDVSLPIHANLHDALDIFCNTLKLISQSQKQSSSLLLILDHLDKLPDIDSHLVMRILNALDDGIILILTFDSGSTLLPLIRSHHTVEPLTMSSLNKAEMNDFIHSNLSQCHRRVTGDQLKMVLRAIPLVSSPLYLQLVFHIVRWWPSHTLPELERFSGKAEVDFNVFLDILEADFGKAFTRYALSLMATARHGLGDNELVHLLAEDSDLLNEIKDEQIESVSVVEGFSYQCHLSRLLSHLGKFVTEIKMEGETVFQLSSHALVTSIKNRYLSDSFFYTTHKRLATFFLFIRRGLLLSSRDISEQKHKHLVKLQWRRLRCVPYHLCHSSDDPTEVWQLLKEKVFFNFSWIVNEVYSGFYNDFLDDIKYALEHVDLDPHIQYLQHFLISIRQTVIHNPMSLAAIFSCQNIQESDTVKDSIHAIVQDAREWLKQVHTQALVPVDYTSDKTNRLFIKRHTLKSVDDIVCEGSSAQLFALRGRFLSVINMVSGVEIPLASLDDTVHKLNVTEDGYLIVLTINDSEEIKVEVISAKKGKHMKSIFLGTSQLVWFDFRSMNEAYISTSEGIKKVNIETKRVTNLSTMRKPWVCSHVTLGDAKIITVFLEEKLKVDVLSLEKGDFKRFSFKNQELNQHCNPILSTNDGKYIVLVFVREAIVIDALKLEELERISLNGLPITHAVLSRSHEHVFIAYANGNITCHVLYTGNQSMVAKIVPKVQKPVSKFGSKSPRPPSGFTSPRFSPMAESSPVGDRRHSKRRGWTKTNEPETIICMVTSEDDHFVFCGTTCGIVYGIHVPTGLQVVAILTHDKPVRKLIFLTNQEHFQHLVILDDEGRALHWNMRPLFKQARLLLHNYIIDEDLLKEEEPKRELREYYPIFHSRRSDRVFLNGPDIAAFYKDPPADVFVSLQELDPAFKPIKDWEETGTIADCSDNIKYFVSGNKLGDILLTISRDQRLARWSLHDGHLVWARRLAFGRGKIQDAALVYYDQALLLTERSEKEKGLRISVIYIGENQTKMLTRTHAIGYWASADRCQIMIMFRNPANAEEVSICHWDLLNAREEVSDYHEAVGENGVAKGNVLFTTFSPDLTQMVRLSLVVEDKVELSAKRSSNTALEMSRESSSFSKVDGQLRQHSPSGRRSPLGLRMRRLDSMSPDPHLNSPSYEDIHVTIDDRQQQSFSLDGEKKSSQEAEAELFDITTLLTWNKLHLRNREYAMEAQMRSAANSRMSQSERQEVVSPIKQIDELPESDQNNANAPITKDSDNTDHAKVQTGKRVDEKKTDTRENDGIALKSKEDNALMGRRGINFENRRDVIEEEDEEEEDSCQKSSVLLRVELTALSFVSEENILIGTNSSHVMLLNIPTFQAAIVLTSEEPRLVPLETLKSSLVGIKSPHRGVVNFVGSSEDGTSLVSADSGMVCLWNTADRTLAMVIPFENGKEITHMTISKDAAVIVIATNDRVIHVWTSVSSPRKIASYMPNFDIVDLQMSCDCHKVIVGGKSQEEFLLEIFELKNIDDILMHISIRKHSQEEEKLDERRDSKLSKRRGSRRMSLRRRSSLNIST